MKTESTITGYAAVYFRPGDKNTEASIGGQFIERIRPGAFANALREGGAIASYTNHDANFLLAREGTDPLSLLLHEDDTGLHVQIFPFETGPGRDALEMVRVGGLRGMSFGFSMAGGKDEWHVENGIDVRTIVEIGQLFDASPVVHPAYPGTSCKIEPASRSVAARLAGYEQIARSVQASETTDKGKRMQIERADDRTRGAKRAELQLATRLRLYDRIARLKSDATRSASIDLELADLGRQSANLKVCEARHQ
jgi:hypothetical protein